MSDTIEWAEPPPTALRPNARAGQYAPFAAALRDNVDAWAIIPHKVNSGDAVKALAQNIRRGKVKGFEPAGAFTTALDGMTLYVKYVGLPDEEPEKGDESS